MNKEDFKIYREGHLEGYEIGLRDSAYVEKRLRTFLEGVIIGILCGIGIFTISLISLKLRGIL